MPRMVTQPVGGYKRFYTLLHFWHWLFWTNLGPSWDDNPASYLFNFQGHRKENQNLVVTLHVMGREARVVKSGAHIFGTLTVKVLASRVPAQLH